MEFLPRGFLQMIYVDTTGFNRQHYNFNYVGREFLGQVRCLVFDVDPIAKGDKGRFCRPDLGGRPGLSHRALQRRLQQQVQDHLLLQF